MAERPNIVDGIVMLQAFADYIARYTKGKGII